QISGTPARFGSGGITVSFFDLTSGGFSVDGAPGALISGAFTTLPNGFAKGSGFFVNGLVAQPDVNFFVKYLGATPTFDAQVVSSLATLTNILTPAGEDKTGDVGPGKDEKKNQQAECR